MDLMKQASRRQSPRYYVFTVLLLVFACGVSPEAARGQWTTSSTDTNNINNTNTGNVGIGTAAPTAKLDVNGSATFSGATTVAGRGVFAIDASNNLNLSMSNHFKINSSSIIMNGAFETFDNYFGMRHTPNNSLSVRIPASGSAYFNQGNVGINITAPVGFFNVTGNGTNHYDASLQNVLVNAQQATNGAGQTRHSLFGSVSLGHDNTTASGVYGHATAADGQNYSLGSMAGVRGYAAAPPLTVVGNTFQTYGGHFVGENPNTTSHGNAHHLYGIYAKAGSSFGTAAEIQYAGYFENNITAGNNAFGLYQATAGARNYFAGNVGIGTTTPLGKLDVVGASGAPNYSTGLTGVLRVGAAHEHIEFGYVAGNRTWIQGFGSVPLYINEGGNNVILNSGSGNVGIGTTAPAYKLHVNGEINATGLRINGTPIGTGGSSQWTTSGSNVYYSTGNIGIGTTAPTTPLHVLSNNANVLVGNISSGYGAIGFQSTLNVNNYALTGGATETVLNTPAGTALKLRINNSLTNTMVLDSTGNVGIGTAAPTSKLHVIGDITVTGNINAKYQDVAEWVPSSQKLAAGTVVALDPEKSNHVLASSEAYDTKVAGVISAQPGISLGESGEGKVLVATTGRVKVKVDATHAPIRIGDLLVTSGVAGVAMKSEPVSVGGRRMHAPGTLIGKALEPLAQGTGEILVLLSLQ